MDRQTREVLANLALARAEGTYRTRGAERHAARKAAKARQQERSQQYTCAQCAQTVPFVLDGVCDHCRQGQFFFYAVTCQCRVEEGEPCHCLASVKD